jgi:hypothetical protein
MKLSVKRIKASLDFSDRDKSIGSIDLWKNSTSKSNKE